MADNYLERRMDDYRNGRLSRENRSHTIRRAARQSTILLATHAVSPLVGALAAILTAMARIAVTGTESDSLRLTAQSHGARYYPGGNMYGRIAGDYTKVDIGVAIISTPEDECLIADLTGICDNIIIVADGHVPHTAYNTVIHSGDTKATAVTVRLLANSDAAYLSGVTVTPRPKN